MRTLFCFFLYPCILFSFIVVSCAQSKNDVVENKSTSTTQSSVEVKTDETEEAVELANESLQQKDCDQGSKADAPAFKVSAQPIEIEGNVNAQVVNLELEGVEDSGILLGKFNDYVVLDQKDYQEYYVPDNSLFAFSSLPKEHENASIVYGIYNTPYKQLHVYEDEYIGGYLDSKIEHIYKIKTNRLVKTNDEKMGDVIYTDNSMTETYTFDQTWLFEYDNPYIVDGDPQADRKFSFHLNTTSGAILLKHEEAYWAEMQPWVLILPDGNYFQKITPEHGDPYLVQYFPHREMFDMREYSARSTFERRKDSAFLNEYTVVKNDPQPLNNACEIPFPCYKEYNMKPFEGMSNIEVEKLILATVDTDFSAFYLLYKSDAMPEGRLFLHLFGVESLPGHKMTIAYEGKSAKGKDWYKLTCISNSNETVTIENVKDFLPSSY